MSRQVTCPFRSGIGSWDGLASAGWFPRPSRGRPHWRHSRSDRPDGGWSSTGRFRSRWRPAGADQASRDGGGQPQWPVGGVWPWRQRRCHRCSDRRGAGSGCRRERPPPPQSRGVSKLLPGPRDPPLPPAGLKELSGADPWSRGSAIRIHSGRGWLNARRRLRRRPAARRIRAVPDASPDP